MNPFYNRLKKRARHLQKWSKRWPTTAYRVYDRDVPEYRWSVDWYGDHIFLQEYPSSKMSDAERRTQRQEVRQAIKELLGVSDQKFLHERVRERQRAGRQYQKKDSERAEFKVTEGKHTFLVNLNNYIDTGLFLDHRESRKLVAKWLRAHGKGARLLNLFCYTGAFSVWGAAAGAHTTSVDLSNTYLDWAKRNFEANQLDPRQHVFQRTDILQWLPREVNLGRQYEVIVLDPPTFSRGAKMERDFDIQRDHVELISQCLKLLAPGGKLLFSTNFRRFELELDPNTAHIEEITSQTLPEDFRPGIHRAWAIQNLHV